MKNIQLNEVLPRLSDTTIAKGYIAIEINEKKTKILTSDNDAQFWTENKVVLSNPTDESPIKPNVGDYVFLMKGASPAGQIETVTKKLIVYSIHQVLASFKPLSK